MARVTLSPLALALVLGALPSFRPAWAKPLNLQAPGLSARNLAAPAALAPPGDIADASDDPRGWLLAARSALLAERPSETRDALEHAEARLLGRAFPVSQGVVPDRNAVVLDIAAARSALSVQDRKIALRLIDAAIAAIDTLQLAPPAASPAGPPIAPLLRSAAQPPAVPIPIMPVTARALLPGHWTLRGTDSVWVPPDTRLRPVRADQPVPGHYVWRGGAWVWVPAS